MSVIPKIERNHYNSLTDLLFKIRKVVNFGKIADSKVVFWWIDVVLTFGSDQSRRKVVY